jgi:hypothetical protein
MAPAAASRLCKGGSPGVAHGAHPAAATAAAALCRVLLLSRHEAAPTELVEAPASVHCA